jgi:uncharacterized protein YndB with AHSA1/START domain
MIPARPEQVWVVLVDPSRFSEWQASTDRVVGGDERLDRVGASYTVISRLRSRTALTGAASRSAPASLWRTRMIPATLRTTNWLRGQWRVTRLVPDHLLELTGTAPGGAHGVLTQTLESLEAGTEYTIDMSYELPAGFLGAMADRVFVERVLERDFRDSAQNLSRMLATQDTRDQRQPSSGAT